MVLPFFPPTLYLIFKMKNIMRTSSYETHVYSWLLKKWVTKRPIIRHPWHPYVDCTQSKNFELEQQARYRISNSSLYSWYGLMINYCAFGLIRGNTASPSRRDRTKFGTFLGCNNLAQINNMEKYIYRPIYHPLVYLPLKY